MCFCVTLVMLWLHPRWSPACIVVGWLGLVWCFITICGWALRVCAWHAGRGMALSHLLCDGPQQDWLMLQAGEGCTAPSWSSACPAPCRRAMSPGRGPLCQPQAGLAGALGCLLGRVGSPVLLQPLSAAYGEASNQSNTFAGQLLALVIFHLVGEACHSGDGGYFNCSHNCCFCQTMQDIVCKTPCMLPR